MIGKIGVGHQLTGRIEIFSVELTKPEKTAA